MSEREIRYAVGQLVSVVVALTYLSGAGISLWLALCGGEG